MSVTIKAFGHIASLLGAREIVVPCEGQQAISTILARLKSEHPRFSNYLGELNEENLLILHRGKIEDEDSLIDPGDELVLVTPISGG